MPATAVRATVRRGVLAAWILSSIALAAPNATAQAPAPSPSPATPRPRAAGDAFAASARRAERARAAGRLDEAALLYREALRLKPSWVEGQWALGAILYDIDRYAEARDLFARVSAAQPANGAALAMKGLCEFQLRAYDQALADLQRARSLGLLGGADTGAKARGEAGAAASAQLASVVGYHAGILLTRAGQYELAFEALREFALRGVESPYLVEAFGLSVLRLAYLPSEAPVEKREMILLAGHAGMLMAHGRRSAAARARFEDLERRFPHVAAVHYAFGTYLVPEEPDAALEAFRRVLAIEPEHVPALLQIAFEQIKRGQPRQALPLAEKAAQLAPGFFPVRNALGRALLDLGELDRAIAELEAGVRLAPDSPDMHFALSRAYQRAGRSQDAERARAAFVELDRARAEQALAGRKPQPER
jgi:tetratricopeptide (TPR) repeat protein